MIDFLLKFREIAISKIIKDTSIIFVGNAFAAILGILFTIIAARLLGPEGWGIVAAVISFITIMAALGDLGLTSSLFRFASKKWNEGNQSQAQKVFQALFTLRLITATLFLLVLIILSPWIAPLIFKLQEPLIVILGAGGLLGSLLIDFQIASLEAQRSWRKAAIFIAWTNLFRVILLLLLSAIQNLTIINTLIVFSISPIIAFLSTLLSQKVSLGGINEWQKTISTFIPFSSWMGINRVISAVNSRLDTILLLQLATPLETGIFAAARQLAHGIPIALGSFATVLAPRFATEEGDKLRNSFKTAMLLSLFMSIALVVGVIFAGPIISLFGNRYISSIPVLQLFFIALIPFALSTAPVNLLIYSFHRPQIIAILSVLQLPIVILGNLYLIPKLGVLGPAVVFGFVNFLTLTVTALSAWYYLRKMK